MLPPDFRRSEWQGRRPVQLLKAASAHPSLLVGTICLPENNGTRNPSSTGALDHNYHLEDEAYVIVA